MAGNYKAFPFHWVAIPRPLVLPTPNGYRIPRCIVPASDVDAEFAMLHAPSTWSRQQLEQNRLETTRDRRLGQPATSSRARNCCHDPRLHSEVEKTIGKDPTIRRVRRSSGRAAQLRLRRAKTRKTRFWPTGPRTCIDIEASTPVATRRSSRATAEGLETESVIILLSRCSTPSETRGLRRDVVKSDSVPRSVPGGHTAIRGPRVSKSARVGIVILFGDHPGGCVIVDGDRGRWIIRRPKSARAIRQRASTGRSLAERLVNKSEWRPETRRTERGFPQRRTSNSRTNGALPANARRWDRLYRPEF